MRNHIIAFAATAFLFFIGCFLFYLVNNHPHVLFKLFMGMSVCSILGLFYSATLSTLKTGR